MSEMSKILTPRKRSFCAAGKRRFFSCPSAGGGSGGNPCVPQSRRPFGISTDINSRFPPRSEEHTSELQSHLNLVCRLLLEKKNHTSELQSHLNNVGHLLHQ